MAIKSSTGKFKGPKKVRSKYSLTLLLYLTLFYLMWVIALALAITCCESQLGSVLGHKLQDNNKDVMAFQVLSLDVQRIFSAESLTFQEKGSSIMGKTDRF